MIKLTRMFSAILICAATSACLGSPPSPPDRYQSNVVETPSDEGPVAYRTLGHPLPGGGWRRCNIHVDRANSPAETEYRLSVAQERICGPGRWTIENRD